ncbi:MAG: hypothetical protein ACL7BU_14985 [Candidatus Phlomobacter fragariae]
MNKKRTNKLSGACMRLCRKIVEHFKYCRFSNNEAALIFTNTKKFSPVDIRPLRIFLQEGSNIFLGGVIFRTLWSTLDIQFLWITENERKKGLERN